MNQETIDHYKQRQAALEVQQKEVEKLKAKVEQKLQKAEKKNAKKIPSEERADYETSRDAEKTIAAMPEGVIKSYVKLAHIRKFQSEQTRELEALSEKQLEDKKSYKHVNYPEEYQKNQKPIDAIENRKNAVYSIEGDLKAELDQEVQANFRSMLSTGLNKDTATAITKLLQETPSKDFKHSKELYEEESLKHQKDTLGSLEENIAQELKNVEKINNKIESIEQTEKWRKPKEGSVEEQTLLEEKERLGSLIDKDAALAKKNKEIAKKSKSLPMDGVSRRNEIVSACELEDKDRKNIIRQCEWKKLSMDRGQDRSNRANNVFIGTGHRLGQAPQIPAPNPSAPAVSDAVNQLKKAVSCPNLNQVQDQNKVAPEIRRSRSSDDINLENT